VVLLLSRRPGGCRFVLLFNHLKIRYENSSKRSDWHGDNCSRSGCIYLLIGVSGNTAGAVKKKIMELKQVEIAFAQIAARVVNAAEKGGYPLDVKELDRDIELLKIRVMIEHTRQLTRLADLSPLPPSSY
jgi:hypothetical protein